MFILAGSICSFIIHESFTTQKTTYIYIHIYVNSQIYIQRQVVVSNGSKTVNFGFAMKNCKKKWALNLFLTLETPPQYSKYICLYWLALYALSLFMSLLLHKKQPIFLERDSVVLGDFVAYLFQYCAGFSVIFRIEGDDARSHVKENLDVGNVYQSS